MKIEIGESLFYSWLRHVKNCELVHLNWSTSPEWDYKADKEQLNKIVKETEVFLKKNMDPFMENGMSLIKSIRK